MRARSLEIKLTHFLHEKGYKVWEQGMLTWPEIKMICKGQEFANRELKNETQKARRKR